ncbi:hypothetical protein P5V30_20625 [Mycobacteroides abscessus subsp. abscessus]|uniref:hypothetical protein n=1 Tax=Mycobacteroides abscessus TaxID=36809 RepID=UPI00092C9EF1|nr:hypothetical protein [Mycobacteroides abscessus]MDO2986939.1 hypothetical protein [Mycobacteroides abscessus subsp. abscessus]SID32701.1 Uncharacterised protein [Mycobacteroides abscessus subsp. abscessus]SIJ93705.1 Uncharacterised protein [Mycobacteroides abscessus subsp. abscessus]
MASPPPPGPVYHHGDAPYAGRPRGFLLLIAGVAIIGIGIGVVCGWTLRGATIHDAIAPTPTEAAAGTAAAVGGPSPAQAKQQACDGYSALGAQWSSGYHDWYRSVSSVGQGWTWANPTVKAATDKFFPLQSQIANSLRGLVTPETPAPVSKAINDYASAILTYAATQNTDIPSSEMDARMDRINSAADEVIRVCGI